MTTDGQKNATRGLRLYWYAPFNNAYELSLAMHLPRPGDTLLVHASRTQRDTSQPTPPPSVDFRRDLPGLPTPGRGGLRGAVSTNAQRGVIAMERALRRRSAVSRSDYDLAHIHTVDLITDGIAVPLLQRSLPHLVLSVHNVRPHVSRLPRRLETLVLRRAYSAASLLLVAHPVLRKQLVTEFGLPEDRISLVPLPIPVVANFDDRCEEPDVFRILFFGTFRPNKGILVALQAIRATRSTIAPLRFHFAGRGDAGLERELREAAASDPRISVEVGYVSHDRRSELFRSADMTLLPYTSLFAQSGVLSDAYSYGVPAIVSDVGALGEIVRDDGTGWLVPPNDAEALAAAILSAHGDPERREAVRNTMLRLARRRTPEEVAKQIRNAYSEL